MSIMTIDAATYRYIRGDTFDRYVRNGMTKAEAAQKAQELMDSAFVCDDPAYQTDYQWDFHNPEANRWFDETQLKPQTS